MRSCPGVRQLRRFAPPQYSAPRQSQILLSDYHRKGNKSNSILFIIIPYIRISWNFCLFFLLLSSILRSCLSCAGAKFSVQFSGAAVQPRQFQNMPGKFSCQCSRLYPPAPVMAAERSGQIHSGRSVQFQIVLHLNDAQFAD